MSFIYQWEEPIAYPLNNINKQQQKFRSRRWGSSLPGLRTQDPPLSPPSTWAEIFRRMCLQSHLQTSPPLPQKTYPMFRTPMKTSSRFFLICPPKLGFFGGDRGGPPKFGFIGIIIFLLLGSPYTISEPYKKAFWDIFEISPFSGQNRVIWGGRGVPEFFLIFLIFDWNPNIYVT